MTVRYLALEEPKRFRVEHGCDSGPCQLEFEREDVQFRQGGEITFIVCPICRGEVLVSSWRLQY